MQFIERLKNRVFGFIKKENGAVNLLDVAFAVGIGAALAAVVVPAATSALSTAKARRDVIIQITALPANLQRLVDESMDDGVANTGWVQTGEANLEPQPLGADQLTNSYIQAMEPLMLMTTSM